MLHPNCWVEHAPCHGRVSCVLAPQVLHGRRRFPIWTSLYKVTAFRSIENLGWSICESAALLFDGVTHWCMPSDAQINSSESHRVASLARAPHHSPARSRPLLPCFNGMQHQPYSPHRECKSAINSQSITLYQAPRLHHCLSIHEAPTTNSRQHLRHSSASHTLTTPTVLQVRTRAVVESSRYDVGPPACSSSIRPLV